MNTENLQNQMKNARELVHEGLGLSGLLRRGFTERDINKAIASFSPGRHSIICFKFGFPRQGRHEIEFFPIYRLLTPETGARLFDNQNQAEAAAVIHSNGVPAFAYYPGWFFWINEQQRFFEAYVCGRISSTDRIIGRPVRRSDN